MNTGNWKANIERILSEGVSDVVTARTLIQVLEVILPEERWDGACYAIASIVHLLIREQGIQSALCLGEVSIDSMAFDHGWVEINSLAYDIAIAKPLQPAFANPPVVKGLDVETMEPTSLRYGVASGFPPDSPIKMVLSIPFHEYMDGFPAHRFGLWGVTADIGKTLGLRNNASELRKRHRDVLWTLRRSK
jgi:hypothetical protein